MSRLGALRKTSSITGEMSRSGVTNPGTSAFVESISSRSTPSSPSRENPARSVRRPSRGSWSSLMSPVCRTVPPGVRMATARASGIEWLTAKNSQSNEPKWLRSPSRTSSRCGVRRCSLHFAATSASVKRDPTTSRSGFWRSRNGTAPMWSSCPWVSTSASMSSSRSSMVRKSGRIRSTPGDSSDREEHAAVDDEQPPAVLEHGHVAADLADAAERDDAQGTLGERLRRDVGDGAGGLRDRLGRHAGALPAVVRRARRSARAGSSAGRSGSGSSGCRRCPGGAGQSIGSPGHPGGVVAGNGFLLVEGRRPAGVGTTPGSRGVRPGVRPVVGRGMSRVAERAPGASSTGPRGGGRCDRRAYSCHLHRTAPGWGG